MCKSLQLALDGLLPCTLHLGPDDPPAKLAWVVCQRPRVSRVEVSGLSRQHSMDAHLLAAALCGALMGVSREVRCHAYYPLKLSAQGVTVTCQPESTVVVAGPVP